MSQWMTSRMFFWMPLLNTSLSTSLSFWVSLSVPLNNFSPAPRRSGKTRRL